MSSNFFDRHWYAAPALSGLLLVLSFHPFNLWPLVFVALVPLYRQVLRTRPLWHVARAGFITGALFALSLSYFTVIQFHWLASAHLFADLVRLSFFPIALIGGLCCALGVSMYKVLYSRFVVLNTLVGAAAYSVGEMLLYAACGGYYFAMLGYAVSPITPLMLFAGLGGAFFVSFIVAGINTFLVEILMRLRDGRRSLLVGGGGVTAVLVALFVVQAYMTHTAGIPQMLRVAIIQTGQGIGFGKEQGKVFTFPALKERIVQAAQGAPDLLVYPFSPVEGAFYRGAKPQLTADILIAPESSFARWVTPLLPASTTIMVWTTSYSEAGFYNVFQFYSNGERSGEYAKRARFPFIDYTPQWAQKAGFYSTPVDMTEGPPEQSLEVQGVRVAALLCSEIHRQDLARIDALTAPVIISAGSEAIFVDDVASQFSLKAAQFRAVENDIHVVRANILGPSGVVAPNGALLAVLSRGEDGVLSTALQLYPPHKTLYSRFGNLPVVLLVILTLLVALAVRVHPRYNIYRDQ